MYYDTLHTLALIEVIRYACIPFSLCLIDQLKARDKFDKELLLKAREMFDKEFVHVSELLIECQCKDS